MKKTLNQVFDEANANEIDTLVKQNPAPIISDDTLSSIKERVYTKTNLNKKKKSAKKVWFRLGAIAACFVLIVSALIVMQKTNSPDIPTWDTAHYSAEDIANLFNSAKNDGVATNAYTEIYVPNSKYLYIGNVTNSEYLDLYQYTETDKKLSDTELQSFIDSFLPALSEALNVQVPQYNIAVDHYSNGNRLSADITSDPYFLSISQNNQRNSLFLDNWGENRQIVIDGEVVQIDQRLSDEEILDSLQSIKTKLFGILNVSFPDAKIVRRFNSYEEHGATWISVYFYDEDAHPLNSTQNPPITDYVCIKFDNSLNYADDIVSDSILSVSTLYYFKNRSSDIDTQYHVVAHAKRISISEAEALLYHGYVFGGHSCALCMKAQDKVSFENYDFVDVEYIFEYNNKDGTPKTGIPFYAFYKNIGTSKNGNTIYAKTYVPAIQISGYDEYFKSQEANHRND